MDSQELLKNIFYGYEIDDLRRSAAGLDKSINQYIGSYDLNFEILSDVIGEFYRTSYSGVFGGQITAGDAIFIYSMMDAIKPSTMLEFGVASGFSSANILYFADKLGLLLKNKRYLTSFDLDDGSLSGKDVGSFVQKYFSKYLPFWEFYPGKTSLDLCQDFRKYLMPEQINERVLTFVDAGHNHPWPGVDLISLYKTFNKANAATPNNDCWVMLQDVRMMERWIMDCVRFKVASPAPIRGVEHAYALWPGKKFSGINVCFNMAAINLNIPSYALISYYKELLNYDFECNISTSEIEEILFSKVPFETFKQTS